jgi:hypothetical protein
MRIGLEFSRVWSRILQDVKDAESAVFTGRNWLGEAVFREGACWFLNAARASVD